ncbi:hypothetical protein E2C01_019328 [Portunus trituberculatus]|uniref:Uncharacterized protein n=1 Tax=Portunus trituberculatus TaxID=210409 RepID=A0A5B7E040_PORTR|nr:hypothetical protein [Portunus trituberculatus]
MLSFSPTISRRSGHLVRTARFVALGRFSSYIEKKKKVAKEQCQTSNKSQRYDALRTVAEREKANLPGEVESNEERTDESQARTVPPDRGVKRTLVLAFGNRYPEWMPFLTSDRGQDSNPCA